MATRGAPTLPFSPRELVRASWERARGQKLDPEHLLSPLRFDGDDLRDYRDAHPLATVMPVIRKLLVRDADADSGMLVAVGDAMGRLLWVEGDMSLKSRAESMMFVEGADWNESVAGTSAPGTALALDQAVQIRRTEHFNMLVHDWSCTAVPVHDPQTREVLGVIDITGGDQAVDRHTMPLVEATALAAETELLVQRLAHRRSKPASFAVAGFGNSRTQHTVALSVLGRDEAALSHTLAGTRLSARHSEILFLLATHPAGLSAEALSEALYNEPNTTTLRAEMARLKRVLAQFSPELVPLSRPYRLSLDVHSDASQVSSLLHRGAHRAAVAAFVGDILPGSTAPAVVAAREELRAQLRERVLGDSSLDVVMNYLDSDVGHDDIEGWQLALKLLPPKSPRRAVAVARLETLGHE